MAEHQDQTRKQVCKWEEKAGRCISRTTEKGNKPSDKDATTPAIVGGIENKAEAIENKAEAPKKLASDNKPADQDATQLAIDAKATVDKNAATKAHQARTAVTEAAEATKKAHKLVVDAEAAKAAKVETPIATVEANDKADREKKGSKVAERVAAIEAGDKAKAKTPIAAVEANDKADREKEVVDEVGDAKRKAKGSKVAERVAAIEAGNEKAKLAVGGELGKKVVDVAEGGKVDMVAATEAGDKAKAKTPIAKGSKVDEMVAATEAGDKKTKLAVAVKLGTNVVDVDDKEIYGERDDPQGSCLKLQKKSEEDKKVRCLKKAGEHCHKTCRPFLDARANADAKASEMRQAMETEAAAEKLAAEKPIVALKPIVDLAHGPATKTSVTSVGDAVKAKAATKTPVNSIADLEDHRAATANARTAVGETAKAKADVCVGRKAVTDCDQLPLIEKKECSSLYMMRDGMAWGCSLKVAAVSGHKRCTSTSTGKDLCTGKTATKTPVDSPKTSAWGKPDPNAKDSSQIVANQLNNEKNYPSLGRN